MQNIRKLCFVSILLTSGDVKAVNISFQIEGLSGALEKNVLMHLSTIEKKEVTPDQRFQAYVNDIIHKGLKALGYYEPKINFKLSPFSTRNNQVLIIHITPGEPVHIGNINVILRGDAQTDKDYLNLLNNCPKIGSVLNHGDYDNFKKSLTNLALRKGYFDSHFNKNQLGISLSSRKAFWDIDYDSGKRYRFGAVTFKNSQIREKYLQNLIPFKVGDYYQSSDLGKLNHRLSTIGWFKSVVVTPEFDKVHNTKILPLCSITSPRTKNTIETGIGYSNDIGPHMKAIWKKSWVNSYGHSFITNTNISTLEQQLNFSYKIPLLKNPLEQYYLIQNYLKCNNLDNAKLYSTTFTLSRYWDLSSGWQRAINLYWINDKFTKVNITNNTMLLYPAIVISRTRSCGSLMPIWGDSQRYSINYSNTIWGSDVNFLVIQAQNTWIRTFHNSHRFVIRGNFRWIKTNNFHKVPLELRFFTSSNRNIHGYKYKLIAPKDCNNKIIGISKVATGSLEYLYKMTNKWWWSIFIDSSEALSNIHQSYLKIETGIGIRWHSPIGPIRFDLAVPVNNKEECGLRFYIGLGPEL